MTLRGGKAAGPDEIPAQAIKADIETAVQMLYSLFSKIWEKEEVPAQWKEGIIIKLPKKDLRDCSSYSRNHTPLNARQCSQQGSTGEEEGGCLERIKSDALADHESTVSIGGRTITNLQIVDDIDGLAGTKTELKTLVKHLGSTSKAYGTEISAEETKIMANNSTEGVTNDITESGQALETVSKFKYLGAIVINEGSMPKILSRIAQATAAIAKLSPSGKTRT